jgi:hypothetical protein
MFHIILTSETLLTNQRPLRYTPVSVSVTAADFAINAATAIYVASAATAVFNAATVFTVITTFTIITATIYVVSAASSATAVFTTTITVSVSSTSTSDRSPHSVNPVRLWSYHLSAPFLQSVTSI